MLLSPLWEETEDDKSPSWRLFAIVTAESSPVEDALEEWLDDEQYQAYASGLIDLIEAIGHAPDGPGIFNGNRNICHEAVEGEGIFRLRKGCLRLYFFYGLDRKVVLCPYAEVKRDDKVSKKTRKLLLAAKSAYMEAHAQNALEIKEN